MNKKLKFNLIEKTINGTKYRWVIEGRSRHEIYRHNLDTDKYESKVWFPDMIPEVEYIKVVEEDIQRLKDK